MSIIQTAETLEAYDVKIQELKQIEKEKMQKLVKAQFTKKPGSRGLCFQKIIIPWQISERS